MEQGPKKKEELLEEEELDMVSGGMTRSRVEPPVKPIQPIDPVPGPVDPLPRE